MCYADMGPISTIKISETHRNTWKFKIMEFEGLRCHTKPVGFLTFKGQQWLNLLWWYEKKKDSYQGSKIIIPTKSCQPNHRYEIKSKLETYKINHSGKQRKKTS